MAITAGDVVWNITGDMSELKKAVSDSLQEVTGLKDKFLANSTAIGAGFLGIGAAITGGLALAISSTAEAEKTTAQLEAVLKSTGGAAGLTRTELDEMASSMQKMTTYGDESIRSAQSLLLTFTSIGKDVFPQALETVLDMSTALGQDLKSSSIQLGKALQDPVLGMTALRRVGVNFSNDQIEMVKAMVESGNMMKAQKFILQELATEFGGSASAAADTFSGRLEQISNSLGDLSEAIGFALLGGDKPQGAKDFMLTLRELIDTITQFVIENDKVVGSIGWVVGAFGGLSAVLGIVILAIKPFIIAWGAISAVIPTATSVATAFGAALTQVGVIFNGISVAIAVLAGAITGAFLAAFAAATAAVAAAAIAISSEWENIKKLFSDFIGWLASWGQQIYSSIVDLGVSIGTAFTQMFTDPLGAIQTAWEGLKTYFSGWFSWFSQSVSALGQMLYNLVPNLGVGPSAIMDSLSGIVPGFASGGVIPNSGFVRVGESGPETVYLPAGSNVVSNGGGGGNGGNVTITVNNPTFTDEGMMNKFNAGLGRLIGEQLKTTGAVA